MSSTTRDDEFDQGRRDGFDSGHAAGLSEGLRAGLERGRAEGLRQAEDAAVEHAADSLESLARPIDAMLDQLTRLQSEYKSAQRTELVDLVERVARQVIRAELELQPTRLLAMVEETLATLPVTRKAIEVYLNPLEMQRLVDIDPQCAVRWTLIADPGLAPGECRVKAGHHEADAGCEQRLAVCMAQVSTQLIGGHDLIDEALIESAPRKTPRKASKRSLDDAMVKHADVGAAA